MHGVGQSPMICAVLLPNGNHNQRTIESPTKKDHTLSAVVHVSSGNNSPGELLVQKYPSKRGHPL